MENAFALGMCIALLLAGAAIAGCTSTAPVTSAGHPTAIPVTQNTTLTRNEPVSILYVQTAEKGTFTPGPNQTYSLTLVGAAPYTFYFSDRPYRIAGSVPNNKFISSLNWSPAPNAAISLSQAKSDEDTLILELTKPGYNTTSGDLTYTATIVKDYKKGKLSDFLDDVDAGIPQTFGKVTLFIDSREVSSSLGFIMNPCMINCLKSGGIQEVYSHECYH